MEGRTFGVQLYKDVRHDGEAARIDASTHDKALAILIAPCGTESEFYQPKLRNYLRAKVWDGKDIRWYYDRPS